MIAMSITLHSFHEMLRMMPAAHCSHVAAMVRFLDSPVDSYRLARVQQPQRVFPLT